MEGQGAGASVSFQNNSLQVCAVLGVEDCGVRLDDVDCHGNVSKIRGLRLLKLLRQQWSQTGAVASHSLSLTLVTAQ